MGKTFKGLNSDGIAPDNNPKVDYTPKPTPQMLGTGAAQRAATTIQKQNEQEKARLDQIMKDMQK